MAESKKAKAFPPTHVKYVHERIAELAKTQSIPAKRMIRWVGYMVIAAMLDAARHPRDGEPLFLIKGGVAMELQLALAARATADFDTAFRASLDELETHLDGALRGGFNDFTATRTALNTVRDTAMRRCNIKLAYRGNPFTTIQLEVASVEASMGQSIDYVTAKPLDVIGIEGPATVPCLPVRWIIAQKLHACTEIIADRDNDRFRDLFDLPLLAELVNDERWPEVNAACRELFEGRGKHHWPPTVTIFDGWTSGHKALAEENGSTVTSVHDAAALVERLIARIDAAG